MRKKKEAHGEPKYTKGAKGDKNYKSKSQHSILHRHQKRLSEYKNKESRVKAIDKEISNAKKLLQVETNRDRMFDLNQSIEKMEMKREDINSGKDEIEYLLDSSDIIMKYMELENKETHLLGNNPHSVTNTTELNDIAQQKRDLIDQYMVKFEPDYVSNQSIYTNESVKCSGCDEFYCEVESGFLVCPSCGICLKAIDCGGNLSYKEMQDYDYRPQFTYDKSSHLSDWLRRFTAKENKTIPQDVLDKVVLEAKKERMKDLSLLTEEKVKRYLKKLGLNEYYDNIIGIINRINGRPPFVLTSAVEEKIRTMFQQIQAPFEKYKPPGRKNFLSYSYCLCQFFKILGLHEFAKYFPLLKSADKLRQQDEIFKKIVAEMAEKDLTIKWVFYPSI